MYALTGGRVFTGDAVLDRSAVVVDGGRIAGVVAGRELPSGVTRVDLAGRSLAPGFVDLQVNGGGDVLFGDAPTVEGLGAIVAAHRRSGTTSLLPTFVSGPAGGMARARAAVEGWLASGRPGVLGIHFEGPAIDPVRAGAHDPRSIRDLTAEDLALLGPLDRGVVVVTLDPGRVPPSRIRSLAAAGVMVSLGHSNASFERARDALSSGATGVTHLFNAMGGLAAREPGLAGAALTTDGAYAGIIVDGHHVHPAAVEAAWRAKARGTLFLVTDAMPPVGGSTRSFRLGGHEVRVEDGRCVTAEGILAGSTLDMATAVRNCVRSVGIPQDEALRMASTYPAAFLGLGDRIGRIAPGCRADLVILDDDLRVVETIVGGSRHG